MKPLLNQETYLKEREICDKAQAYAERIMCEGGPKRVRNYLTKEEAAEPVYSACDNEMRGRVEQYELLTDLPADFCAYIGTPSREERERTNLVRCRRYPVTVWTGLELGGARISSSWRVNSYMGSTMHQFHATISGREFTGRGFGEGCVIRLKETAESKRRRAL